MFNFKAIPEAAFIVNVKFNKKNSENYFYNVSTSSPNRHVEKFPTKIKKRCWMEESFPSAHALKLNSA